METTFKINLKQGKDAVPVKKTKSAYGLIIPIECYLAINRIIGYERGEGKPSYSFKMVVLYGLELLKQKYKDLEISPAQERRFNSGGEKLVGQRKLTSITLEDDDILWIDSFISFKRKTEMNFAKPEFLEELTEELKMKYASKVRFV